MIKAVLERVLYAFARSGRHLLSNEKGVAFYKYTLNREFVDRGGNIIDALIGIVLLFSAIAPIYAPVYTALSLRPVEDELGKYNQAMTCIKENCSNKDCINLFEKNFPSSPRLKSLQDTATSYCSRSLPREIKYRLKAKSRNANGSLVLTGFEDRIARALDRKGLKHAEEETYASVKVEVVVVNPGTAYADNGALCQDGNTMYRSCPSIDLEIYSENQDRPVFSAHDKALCGTDCGMTHARANAQDKAFQQLAEFVAEFVVVKAKLAITANGQ